MSEISCLYAVSTSEVLREFTEKEVRRWGHQEPHLVMKNTKKISCVSDSGFTAMIQVTKKRYQQPSNFEDNAIILGQDDIPIGDWDRNWTLNLSLFVNKHSTI